MNEIRYFILPITRLEYIRLKKYRTLTRKKESIYFIDKFNTQDLLLIYISNSKKIVAEYEITEEKLTQHYQKCKIEPIYNAPPTGGVNMNGIIYLQLKTYQTEVEWRMKMRDPVVPISREDYLYLHEKLTG